MDYNVSLSGDLQDRPNEVLRHPDFWLRDGSIILSVQHVLFKVHQTILAQHSEIFADLFDLPQPDPEVGGDELIEGCRVVQLQDSPEDFEDLLRAIYHLDHFDTLSPAASLDDVLVFVTGILRLSTKYMIRGLRAKCIKLLSGRFPTTYDEYLARSPLPRPYSPPAHRSGIDQNAINNLIELTHLTLNSLSDHATANAPNSTSHRSNRPRRSQQVSVALNPANPPPAFPSHGGGNSAPINASVYAYGWQPTTNDGTGLPGGWPPSQPADLSLPGSAPASVANNPQWNTQAPSNPPPSAPATQATTSASSTPPAQAGGTTSQQSHSHGRHTHRHKSKHKTDSPKTAADAPKPTASSVMRAIAVAYEGRVYSVLPYAYYLLARTSSPRRFLSKGNAAPTAAPSSSNPNLTTTAGGAGGSGVNGLPTISWQEKTICLVGRALLRSAELSMSHSFLVAFQPSPSCRQPSRCSNSRGPLLEWALLEAAGKGPEPLKGWDRWDKLGVCQECVGECMRKHEAGRREVWERLPEFFDLEAWAKLRDLQDS